MIDLLVVEIEISKQLIGIEIFKQLIGSSHTTCYQNRRKNFNRMKILTRIKK